VFQILVVNALDVAGKSMLEGLFSKTSGTDQHLLVSIESVPLETMDCGMLTSACSFMVVDDVFVREVRIVRCNRGITVLFVLGIVTFFIRLSRCYRSILIGFRRCGAVVVILRT
jgi:hypothetical protein